MPRILLQQGTNLVNKCALLLHKCWFTQDSRNKPENDWYFWCWLSVCCKLFKYPSPEACASTSPSRGEVSNDISFNVIRGHRPANLKDYRIKSGNDCRVDGTDIKNKTNIILKGLDVVRQYAALLERRVQSSTRARKAQVVTRQTNPTGRSMIEMLGVLAIIGVLSVGGIAGYSKAMTKFKVNKIIDEVMITANNIKTLYANQKNYNGLSDIDLKTSGIVPAEMYDENGEIKNAFNGKLVIQTAYYDDYDNIDKAYSIYINNIPENACLELATQSWQNYFGAVEIGSSLWGPGTVLGLADCLTYQEDPNVFEKGYGLACANYNKIPISPDKAALICDCSASNHLCDFVFTGK